MEMLVVVAIFSTVTVAATDIYLLSTRTQRKVVSIERLAGVARSVMERISRDMRTGRIDYAAYPGPIPVSGGTLSLRDESGESVAYRLETDEGSCLGGRAPCVLIQIGAVSARLTPETITADDLTFFIAPGVDPYQLDPLTGTYASDEAPRVTVVLSLRDQNDPNAAPVTVQTTAVSRTYVR